MTSKIKVDNINKVSDDSNIINKCGTTITLGASGDSIALASGATQTGFGREGSVDWDTASIKSATFTAVSGNGYFVNTTAGAVSVNLPAGSAGNIVAISDYNRTFANFTCSVVPNGSEKIGGVNATAQLQTNGQSATFVYVDGTNGWINVQETNTSVTGLAYMTATVSGACNTLTTCGNCKIATFVNPGTFCVSQAASCSANNLISYLIVGGGGGGGVYYSGGGGGAGGFREVKSPSTPGYTASPLDGYPTPANRVTVGASPYPVAVGGGGAGGPAPSYPTQGINGCVSSFGGITAAGGGGGGGVVAPGGQSPGRPGASGGGGGGNCGSQAGPSGAGNTPPTVPPQGQDGGASNTGGPDYGSGGGGGAGAAGVNGASTGSGSGNGGAGVGTLINPAKGEAGPGPSRYYSGGGGGAGTPSGPKGDGGLGGGADGAPSYPGAGNAGDINTGGGAGGSANQAGYAGGSGIVILRYKFQ